MTQNVDINNYEFEKKKLVLQSYPQKLFVEITRNCNLKCIMCDNRKEKNSPKLNMSLELFKRIGEELFPHVEEIDLRGFGESTIHPQFKSFLEYTAQFNKRILLITNLTKRDDSLWEDLVRKRVYISVSLDGASKETFEKIRPGSTFETIEHNLGIIQHSRDKYNIDPWNINFLVTVQRDNIDELPEIVTLAEKYGFTRIELNHITVLSHKIVNKYK